MLVSKLEDLSCTFKGGALQSSDPVFCTTPLLDSFTPVGVLPFLGTASNVVPTPITSLLLYCLLFCLFVSVVIVYCID